MKRFFRVFLLTILCTPFITVNAISSSDKYNGEYSIDYLLRNYSIVTLGQYDYGLTYFPNQQPNGSVSYFYGSMFPVLISGNLDSSSSSPYVPVNYYELDKPSYIKGKASDILSYGQNGNIGTPNLYLGTSNTINGSTINGKTGASYFPAVNTNDYLDFKKLNNIIINQQQDIKNAATKEINLEDNTVSEPGNYISKQKENILNIHNDGHMNEYYIITVEDTYPTMPYVYCNSNSCSNVIFNFPNAKVITANNHSDYQAHIVAPKADILVNGGRTVYFYGTVIANSIHATYDTMYVGYDSSRLNVSDKLFNTNTSEEIADTDVRDDLFDGEYSIEAMLRNYSVVAFGKNNTTALDMYHVVGGILVNGNLGNTNRDFYIPSDSRVTWGIGQTINGNKVEGMKYNMMSNNDKYASYFTGVANSYAYSMGTSPLFYKHNNMSISGYGLTNSSNDKFIKLFGQPTYKNANYMDFEYLYNSITKEQKRIEKGDTLTKGNDGAITIPVGGYYTIDSLDGVNELRVTNMAQNNNKITVITINDSGEIDLPKETTDIANNVYTNNYLGMTKASYYGEPLFTDTYFGNIVFNFPNATKINFAPNNSFKGHIVAPKAELYLPEMNIAGCLIADRVYAEGHSEAHYYPLSMPISLQEERTKTSVHATIVWDDVNDLESIRPSFVTIRIFVNGVEKWKKNISAADDWTFDAELDLDDPNQEITFSVEQNEVEGYLLTIDKLSSNKFVITNSHTPGAVKGVEENPKTGVFKYLWILILPAVVLFIGYLRFRKSTLFNQE